MKVVLIILSLLEENKITKTWGPFLPITYRALKLFYIYVNNISSTKTYFLLILKAEFGKFTLIITTGQ